MLHIGRYYFGLAVVLVMAAAFYFFWREDQSSFRVLGELTSTTDTFTVSGVRWGSDTCFILSTKEGSKQSWLTVQCVKQ